MPETKFDRTLKLIGKNDSLYQVPNSQLDEEVLEELMAEGLIKKDETNGYSLTAYGEIIEVMGYNSHKKRRQKSEAPGKLKWIKSFKIFVLILLIATLCGCLVFI